MPRSQLPTTFQRDLSAGLQQQMYFWGKDVLSPAGNFLVTQGFKKGPSTGAKGTSCYRLEWQNGHIELYGSCAGWFGPDGGFAFIRPFRRSYCWTSSEETPVPGAWQKDYLKPSIGMDLYQAALPFIDWLIAYEHAALARFGAEYRSDHYRSYRRVPKAKQWIEPAAALQWFKCLRDSPAKLQRPKLYAQKIHA